MNGFVISVGTYVKPLLAEAKAVAGRLGKVEADMGDTACKIPLATEYIAKVETAGKVGQKRKTLVADLSIHLRQSCLLGNYLSFQNS